jgi:hypothetical protein
VLKAAGIVEKGCIFQITYNKSIVMPAAAGGNDVVHFLLLIIETFSTSPAGWGTMAVK